jgi:soluble lytic murein transglycosylase-like protein
MQPRIVFCIRCRGMKVGWNRRYILHWVLCTHWLRSSFRFVFLLAALFFAFPEPSAPVFSAARTEPLPVAGARSQRDVMPTGPAVRSIEAFLKRHAVPEANRGRLAQSIVTSARKYDLNPKLIASVMIIESRGNPFAISGCDAIGIMQIHLPTWGATADREGINLLKIEDNVDFGARILKNYIRQFGLWDGVKRYNGFFVDDPVSEQSAQQYVEKIKKIYELQPSATSQTDLNEETSRARPENS